MSLIRKILSIGVVTILTVTIGYFALKTIDEHIEQKSGEIVERVLLENTINQLILLSEIQSLLEAGKIDKANLKLSEATDTLLYILENNCALPKCESVVNKHKIK